MSVRPVILSGGAGTRLWPLSTPESPKQFADLVPGGISLFAATLGRLNGVPESGAPVVVAGASHVPQVQAELARAGIEGGRVIAEPTGRNTAPAVAAAALVVDREDLLVILPSDHLVADEEGFRRHVIAALELARSKAIVTFGIQPNRPDTGYGYIELGKSVDGAYQVARFKEKPGAAEAEEMVSDGRHLWNSGMFVALAGTVLDTMDHTCPGVVEGVRASLPGRDDQVISLGPSFSDVESISFDNAVMERIGSALVIPIDVGWDDIGSFRALHGSLAQDGRGNAVAGKALLDDVDRSLVIATSRVVAVAGLSRVVVVETPEAVLVVPLEKAQEVRALAERALEA